MKRLLTGDDVVREVLGSLRGNPMLRTREAKARLTRRVCRQVGVPFDERYVKLLTGRPRKDPFKLVSVLLSEALAAARGRSP